jgi:hypothetical protein
MTLPVGVVHRRDGGHETVTKTLMFSGVCAKSKNLSFDIKGLKSCPKIVQTREVSRKQRKILDGAILSANLSPEIVDRIPLVLRAIRLQRGQRIENRTA